jgi:hypothetical protein
MQRWRSSSSPCPWTQILRHYVCLPMGHLARDVHTGTYISVHTYMERAVDLGREVGSSQRTARTPGRGSDGQARGSPNRPPMLILNAPMEWVGGTSLENNLKFVGQLTGQRLILERERRSKGNGHDVSLCYLLARKLTRFAMCCHLARDVHTGT